MSHHHLSSEAHEEQVQVHRGDATGEEGEQQSDIHISHSVSFFILTYSSDLMWLPCFTLQAFSSQKSLPGRPELDKVKVSCGPLFQYVGKQNDCLLKINE